MEAFSVEDQGEGVCFHVYCYNSQPGITIDYATGESWEAGDGAEESAGSSGDASTPEEGQSHYILNTSSRKFHLPDCSGAASISADNRQDYTGTRQDLIDQGYSPCGICKP